MIKLFFTPNLSSTAREFGFNSKRVWIGGAHEVARAEASGLTKEGRSK